MDTNLPRGWIDAFKSADMDRKNRIRVAVDGQEYPVVAMRQSGFTVDRNSTPHLRGCVDLYDGARHIAACLIVRGAPDGDCTQYEFKRRLCVSTVRPLDYVADPQTPIAYLNNLE